MVSAYEIFRLLYKGKPIPITDIKEMVKMRSLGDLEYYTILIKEIESVTMEQINNKMKKQTGSNQ